MAKPEGVHTRPRVSVLMPAFNQGAFIDRAIESLLAQTFTAWELLIVDDCSFDETSERIQYWKSHPQVRCYRLERNRGFAAALNCALDRAQGELIAYLPCDDQYYREHLASLVRCLEAHPRAVLAYAGVRYKQRRGAC